MQFVHWKLAIVLRKIVLFKLWHWNDIGLSLQTAQGHSRKDIAYMNRDFFCHDYGIIWQWAWAWNWKWIDCELNEWHLLYFSSSKTIHVSDQLKSCFHADKQQSFLWAMGSLGGPCQPLCVIVCYDGRLNVLFLNCVFCSNICTFPICAHWHLDFPESVEAGCQSTLFFSSLWAWIYKLKNQAKMTLIRSPSFCRKCSCSAGTGFTATICCIFH